MALIGEFGAAVADSDDHAEPDQFRYYGETFTVKRRVGSMPILRFAAVAQSGADAESLEGLAAMHALITNCIVSEDVHRFETVASEHDDDTDQLMAVCMALYQAVTGRPTSRPSASPGGPSTTGESSRDVSSSEESLPPIQRDPRILELVPVTAAAKRALSRRTAAA